jgi:hypothetical protein
MDLRQDPRRACQSQYETQRLPTAASSDAKIDRIQRTPAQPTTVSHSGGFRMSPIPHDSSSHAMGCTRGSTATLSGAPEPWLWAMDYMCSRQRSRIVVRCRRPDPHWYRFPISPKTVEPRAGIEPVRVAVGWRRGSNPRPSSNRNDFPLAPQKRVNECAMSRKTTTPGLSFAWRSFI